MQVVIADFEGIFKRERRFIGIFRKRNSYGKDIKVLKFEKRDLRKPELIANRLLGLEEGRICHTIREPSIAVILCDLTNETSSHLLKLADSIKHMIRKNPARIILFTNPLAYSSISYLANEFHQIILYDGALYSSFWNSKKESLRRTIANCSEELTYQIQGIGTFFYNCFKETNDIDYLKLKYEVMTLGTPLFSKASWFKDGGEEKIYYKSPDRLGSEIKKIIPESTFLNKNKNFVEIFTFDYVKNIDAKSIEAMIEEIWVEEKEISPNMKWERCLV